MIDLNLTQNNAPVYEALKKHMRNRVVRLDVPGHKGGRMNKELRDFLGVDCLKCDVNSMKPLDNLCHPVSVIKDAEMLAAEAFGAKHAFFIVNGTTAAVQTMIFTSCKAGDKIIMPRNVHRSAINALVVCGAIPVYVNPGTNKQLGIPLGMSVKDVEKAIKENPDAKAVLVNNPTYYGICSDIKVSSSLPMSMVCWCLRTKHMALTFILVRVCLALQWRQERIWRQYQYTKQEEA